VRQSNGNRALMPDVALQLDYDAIKTRFCNG